MGVKRRTKVDLIRMDLFMPHGLSRTADATVLRSDVYNINIPLETVNPANYGMALNLGFGIGATHSLGTHDTYVGGLILYSSTALDPWVTNSQL